MHPEAEAQNGAAFVLAADSKLDIQLPGTRSTRGANNARHGTQSPSNESISRPNWLFFALQFRSHTQVDTLAPLITRITHSIPCSIPCSILSNSSLTSVDIDRRLFDTYTCPSHPLYMPSPTQDYCDPLITFTLPCFTHWIPRRRTPPHSSRRGIASSAAPSRNQLRAWIRKMNLTLEPLIRKVVPDSRAALHLTRSVRRLSESHKFRDKK